MKEKLKKIGIITGTVVGVLVFIWMIFVVTYSPRFVNGGLTVTDSKRDYIYTFTDKGVKLYPRYMQLSVPEDGRWEIPDKVLFMQVISVGLNGLPGEITAVHIPDSVTSFEGPASCEGLVEVTGGTNIENCFQFGNFYECGQLKYVEFLEKNKMNTLSHCFSDCNSLETVTIGGEIKEIGMFTFKNCFALQSITFGENVETVGWYAVFNCPSLTSVTFLNEDVVIEEGAFTGCPWAESPEGKAFIEAHKKIAEN
ncbi:MAG: leucine-rich repeat domain-containing protein [Lachnospiraceae bacterium]|nr:leucine-rich repeat domain-containing protein [Lachnospiraceae bacterium]